MDRLSIAIVEDDADLAEEMAFYLHYQGMRVAIFDNGMRFENWLKQNFCDVLLLDLTLPQEDGLVIAKRLAARADLRIIMLTARVMKHHRIEGFEAGADIYLQKPVDFEELVAIIKRLAKRLPENNQPVWKFKPLTSSLISPNNDLIKLTTSENNFLRYLSDAENYYLDRTELEVKLWGESDLSTTRRLEVLVCRLRQKLDSFNKELIQTYHGEGYGLGVKLKV